MARFQDSSLALPTPMNKCGFLFAALLLACLPARMVAAAPQDSALAASAPAGATTLGGEANVVDQLLGKAHELIGTPYRNGGMSPLTGFDCSGFVGYLFKTNLAMNLPRTSKDMSRVGDKVDKNELKPGDLLFFNTVKRGISHVGIYLGDGKFIHSPWHGSSVEVAYLGMKYWTKRFAVAKRLDLPETLPNPLSSLQPPPATVAQQPYPTPPSTQGK